MIIEDIVNGLEELKEQVLENIKDNTTIEHSAFNPEFKQEKELIDDLNHLIAKWKTD